MVSAFLEHDINIIIIKSNNALSAVHHRALDGNFPVHVDALE